MAAGPGDLSRVTVAATKGGGTAGSIFAWKPGAGAERALEGEHAGALRVAVTAAPEKGRANEEVGEFLAEVLDVARAAVSVVSGHAGRDKSVAIEGLDAEDAAPPGRPSSRSAPVISSPLRASSSLAPLPVQRTQRMPVMEEIGAAMSSSAV